MRKTDKVYNVKVTPHIEHNYLIRVPKGVEINKEILENSGNFDNEWSEEPMHTLASCVEISEVDKELKELWNDGGDPSLHKDGTIHYEGCEVDDLETLDDIFKGDNY